MPEDKIMRNVQIAGQTFGDAMLHCVILCRNKNIFPETERMYLKNQN